MPTQPNSAPASAARPDEIWFTRCPVPTATGIAYKLGWLGEAFEADGIALKTRDEAELVASIRLLCRRMIGSELGQ